MQIAVTSQNRHSITEHAGKCRKFWLYDVEKGAVTDKHLVELPLEESFHARQHGMAEALAGINVLITGSMGNGLYLKLMQRGILSVITAEDNPDNAVSAFLSNSLDRLPLPDNTHCQGHDHHH